MKLRPISTAPTRDEMLAASDSETLLLYRDYGDNTYDWLLGMRSSHGDYWISTPDAEIIEPTHWSFLPDRSHLETPLKGDR